MKTMFYISFLCQSVITEVWCDFKTLLTLQAVCHRQSWKILSRRVMARHYLVGPLAPNGIFKTAECSAR